jgi:hypothetical protein
MRANGRWPRIHDLLDGHLRGTSKRVAADIPQHDAGLVHDHAAFLAGCLYSRLYISETIGETAGWHISAHTIFGTKNVGLFPFCRQATREPVDFARPIVEDLTEPKAFEPPRSSWT